MRTQISTGLCLMIVSGSLMLPAHAATPAGAAAGGNAQARAMPRKPPAAPAHPKGAGSDRNAKVLSAQGSGSFEQVSAPPPGSATTNAHTSALDLSVFGVKAPTEPPAGARSTAKPGASSAGGSPGGQAQTSGGGSGTEPAGLLPYVEQQAAKSPGQQTGGSTSSPSTQRSSNPGGDKGRYANQEVGY